MSQAQLPPRSLQRMIHEPDATIAALGAFLDDMPHAARLEQLYGLGRKDQRRLYQLAKDAEPITRDFFVPSSVAPLTVVPHFGKNTLPLPGFTRFQKVFCRPSDGTPRLFGFNEGRSRPFIGPGYYVAIDTAGNPAWEERGPVVVDYFQVPDGPVVPGWPAIRPNSYGLSFFVYNKTRDYMRRVSKHASVGAAYKGEKSLDHYFILCRGDV